MEIGRQLLRDTARKFNEIGAQFDLLRWIDEEIIKNSMGVAEFVCALTRNLRDQTKAKSASAFALVDEKLLSFNVARGEPFQEAKPFSHNGRNLSDSNNILGTVNDEEMRITQLHARIKTENAPLIFIILEDDYLGFSFSALLDDDQQKFVLMVIRQAEILLKAKIKQLNEYNQHDIINMFFTDKMDPEACYQNITQFFANFLPQWPPFQIDPLPLVQILTYRANEKYILLRASHGEKGRTRLGVQKNISKPLKREETICGLFLDREETGQAIDFLYVNPTEDEYSTRYAAYLYDAPPKSELVIPIRYEGHTIGLINLEHEQADIFNEYHIFRMKEAANFLAPFLNTLISEENEQLTRAYSLRYVLIKVLHRMARTYRHKVGQSIASAKLAVEVLDKPAREFNQDHREFYDMLHRAVFSFSELTTQFLTDMPDFVTFREMPLIYLIDQAVAEFDPDMGQAEDIKITREALEGEIFVFASMLLREHFYNILNNSVFAVRHRLRHNEIEHGLIKITVSLQDQTDLKGKTTSYKLAVVSICDNGGGIAPEHVEEVFKAGFTTKAKEGGSGFGMSAAVEYMETIGGGITLENKNGHGLIVKLLCPIYTPEFHISMERRLNNTIQ